VPDILTSNLDATSGEHATQYVGTDEVHRVPLDQARGLIDIGDLTRRENDAQRIAQGINWRMLID
jgi:hypothetical protein